MKSKHLPAACIILLNVFFSSCERENTQPWDEKINLNPAAWAPQNLQITDVSIIEKKLTWTYGDENIEGFKIDRKEGSENWQIACISLGEEFRTWTDSLVKPDSGLTYEYRLYAFAGPYLSSMKSISSTANELPSPANLQIEKLSDKSYRLTWTDIVNGEQGFKIDRRVENGEWQTEYGLVNENQTSFTDTNVFYKSGLAINVEYQAYTFYQEFISAKTSFNTNAELTAPSNLVITANSITSVTLSWQDNTNGEEGFKIDRQENESSWETEYAILNANQESFTDNVSDLTVKVYTYRIYSYAGQYSSQIVESEVSLMCGYSFTDSRDGNVYETVEIGTQCWMKENLAYLPLVSPPSGGSQTSSYYYVNGYSGGNVSEAKATANYQTYGVLYNWTASLTACPEGWHLPASGEWDVLEDYLGGYSVAGGKMKEVGTAHWNSPNTGATNSSGFTGLPGGYRYQFSYFGNPGIFGIFWSSTESWTTNAMGRLLSHSFEDVQVESYNKMYGLSVRCLRDE